MLSTLSQPVKKKAIAYYRHSAEDKQENSVPIQREHAQKFAQEYDIEIIHEEADEGKTGLLASRPGFEKLFNKWILNEDSPHFDYVLVYDVSRWGRFQDQDEAAYYEFRCKQRGKKVIYISRGFPREEQKLINHLQTSIERYMAAEYSRQLSDKVFHGCAKVAQLGFSAGGTAPYGYGRLLLDANKKPKGILKRGEHKAIDNERVTFTPLNDETTETVKEIYYLLVEEYYSPYEIARELNKKNIHSANGGEWNKEKVIRILTNETYTGTMIYNKTWNRLKQGQRSNPRNEWVFCEDAFPEIVDRSSFRKAQEHLYWLFTSKHKRGIYAIRKVYRTLVQELKSSLEARKVDEMDIYNAIKNFPIVLSTTFYSQSGVPHWCFTVPPEMWRYENVLGIGLNLDKPELVEHYFLLSNNESAKHVHIFGENDKYYEKVNLGKEHVDSTLEKIISGMKHTPSYS